MEGGGYRKTEMPLTLCQNQNVPITMAMDGCPAVLILYKGQHAWICGISFIFLHQTFCDLLSTKPDNVEGWNYVGMLLPALISCCTSCCDRDKLALMQTHRLRVWMSWMWRTLRQNMQTKWEWIGWEDRGLSGIGPLSLLVSLSFSFKFVINFMDIVKIWATDEHIIQSKIRSNNTGLQHFLKILWIQDFICSRLSLYVTWHLIWNVSPIRSWFPTGFNKPLAQANHSLFAF